MTVFTGGHVESWTSRILEQIHIVVAAAYVVGTSG